MKALKLTPTLRSLHIRLTQGEEPLALPLTTLWRRMRQLGFKVVKKSKYESYIKERSWVVAQRLRYIREVKVYRRQNRPLFYQDESWITKNLTEDVEWNDSLDEEDKPSEVPPGPGARSILCGIGSSSVGWLPGSFVMWRGSSALVGSDYHSEMNWNVFKSWMRDKVFPVLPPHSVVIIDRASYHLVLTKATQPCRAVTKEGIYDWLVLHQVALPPKAVALRHALSGGISLQELKALAKEYKPAPCYKICRMAEKLNRTFKSLSYLCTTLNLTH